MDFDFTTETITPDATGILTIAGAGGVEISVGTTGERPLLPIDGTIRYNTTDSKFEFYQNSVWINILSSPLTTKGDLYTHNATVDARLPVGTSGYFLKANPATATGLEWVQNPAITLASVDEEPTGFPNRVDSAISFDAGTRIFTIEPNSPATQFSVYQRGVEFIKTAAETVTLPNTTGLYFISYDVNGALQSSTTKYDLSEQAPVALIYWNAVAGYETLFGEERHGLTMDWATHSYLHDTRGTQYVSGFAATDYTITGDGNSNSDAQVGIQGGVIADEDIYLTIVDDPTPTNSFEQILSPIGEYPVLYRQGSGGVWYIDTATLYPLKMGTTYPTWNEDNAGTWSATEVVPNAFIAMFLLATNDPRHPVVAVMGQNESVSLPNAIRDNTFYALDLGTIPFLEFRPLYRLIFEVKSNFGNAVKSKLVDLTDIRLAPTIQIEQATAVGTVISVDVSGGATGLTTTGGPITSSGTITLAGTLATTNGGTGLTSIGTANQVLGVNTGATGLEYKTVTAGTAISVTPSAGAITIANTGVTSAIAGTGISVSSATGAVTIGNTGVLSFSAGTTGLTPNTATTGAVTLAGILALTNGGTNANLTAVNGGAVYSTGSALAITAAGTSGQVLTSNGAAAPTWQAAAGALQLYKENPSTPTAPSATGTNAVAIMSGSAASGTNAIAIGAGTSANVNNIFAYANGNFATAGDAQDIRFTVRNTTTDATVTTLFIDGSSQRMILPNNSAWIGRINLVGRRTDATGGSATFAFDVGITRDATAATTVLQGSARTIVSRTSGSLTASVSADTTNGALQLDVSGLAGQTFRWVATVELTQVTN